MLWSIHVREMYVFHALVGEADRTLPPCFIERPMVARMAGTAPRRIHIIMNRWQENRKWRRLELTVLEVLGCRPYMGVKEKTCQTGHLSDISQCYARHHDDFGKSPGSTRTLLMIQSPHQCSVRSCVAEALAFYSMNSLWSTEIPQERPQHNFTCVYSIPMMQRKESDVVLRKPWQAIRLASMQ